MTTFKLLVFLFIYGWQHVILVSIMTLAPARDVADVSLNAWPRNNRSSWCVSIFHNCNVSHEGRMFYKRVLCGVSFLIALDAELLLIE
jgi:hypothetical protein